jgi:hypothetical protein
VQLALAAGQGTSALVDARALTAVATIDQRWLFQLGGQGRWYAFGGFARGLFVAADARLLWLTGEAPHRFGLALGPEAGAKWGPVAGWTLEVSAGGAVVVNTMRAVGSGERLWKANPQPAARLLLGWTW